MGAVVEYVSIGLCTLPMYLATLVIMLTPFQLPLALLLAFLMVRGAIRFWRSEERQWLPAAKRALTVTLQAVAFLGFWVVFWPFLLPFLEPYASATSGAMCWPR